MNAMSPAEIISIEIDEESFIMDIAVSKKHLSQAIGKNGQNIRSLMNLDMYFYLCIWKLRLSQPPLR